MENLTNNIVSKLQELGLSVTGKSNLGISVQGFFDDDEKCTPYISKISVCLCSATNRTCAEYNELPVPSIDDALKNVKCQDFDSEEYEEEFENCYISLLSQMYPDYEIVARFE